MSPSNSSSKSIVDKLDARSARAISQFMNQRTRLGGNAAVRANGQTIVALTLWLREYEKETRPINDFFPFGWSPKH